MKDIYRHMLLAGAGFAAISGQGAAAQQSAQDMSTAAESGGLGEIVVTAQRRSESVQDAALAITAVSGDALVAAGISDVLSLGASVPNVQFGQAQAQARLAIRGIGLDTSAPGAEARVAYTLDGVYVSRPSAVMATFFDVDRIEVLRGPQGTLYGRNAIAGNINVLTRDPTDVFQGYAQAMVGNYNAVTLEGGVGGPVAPGVAFRIAGQTQDRSGFGRNVTTGKDINDLMTRAVRAKLKIEPSAALTINLSADYFYEKDAQGGYNYVRECSAGLPVCASVGPRFGGVLATDPRDTAADFGPTLRREIYGFAGTVDWDIGDGTRITAVTGYRNSHVVNTYDQDYTALRLADYTGSDKSWTFSQELRVSHRAGAADIVVGAYYFHETDDGLITVPVDGRGFGRAAGLLQGFYSGGRIKTDATALFGQINYALTDQFTIEVGARYSWETKRKFDEIYQFDLVRPYDPANAAIPAVPSTAFCPAGVAAGLIAATEGCFIAFDRTVDRAFSPKATIRFQPGSNVTAYLSYARGFKSGGFALTSAQRAFAPETVTDIEGGIKAEWFDRRLRTNIAAFHYDYSNIQAQRISGSIIEVDNASSAKVYGVELELVALPARGLQVDINAGYLHARYGDYITRDPFTNAIVNLRGNHLYGSPPYTIDAGIQYALETSLGDFTLRGAGHFMGRTHFSQFNEPSAAQDAYATFDLMLNFESRNRSVYGGLFVKNIGDRNVYVALSRNSAPQGSNTQGILQAPRTYGVRLGYRF